jgi:hypothetical protein
MPVWQYTIILAFGRLRQDSLGQPELHSQALQKAGHGGGSCLYSQHSR